MVLTMAAVTIYEGPETLPAPFVVGVVLYPLGPRRPTVANLALHVNTDHPDNPVVTIDVAGTH